MKKLLFWSKCLTVIFSLLFSVCVYAAEDNIPKTINIQGKLTTDSGQPVTETKTLNFEVFDESGTSIFTESTSVTPDAEGLYSTNIDISRLLNDGKNFNGKYSFTVAVGGVSSLKTNFASSPNAFYASTSTYALSLDVNGDKLVNENFNQSTEYNITVGSATYAVKASSINANGTSGYVWGMTGANSQGWMNPGSLSISTASTSVVGGIMLGADTGLSRDISSDSVLKLLSATGSTIGGVIVPAVNGLSVSSDGTLSISPATDNSLGVVSVPAVNGLSISNGAIRISTPTTSSFGVVNVTNGNGLTITDGTIALGKASTNALGTVRIGDNINVDSNGVISLKPATDMNLGLVKVGSGLTVSSDGEISVNSSLNVSTATYAINDGAGNLIVNYYQTVGNKTDSYSETSTTKYPTSKALSDGLAMKQNSLTAGTNITFSGSDNNTINATVNDATLTIQRNGSLIDTFTANSSNDKTINIEVPTITDTYSDSSSDGMSGVAVASAISGKANSADLSTVATSGNYNDLSNTPTIPTYSAGDGIEFSGTTIKAKVDGTNIKINAQGEIDLGPGADLAEIYQSTEKLVPGDVVSIDTARDNAIVKTKVAEDTLVAGVISTEPGLLLNKNEKGYKLALVGKVPTKVCSEGGNIKRGDLLVSSSIAGYAKKAGDNPKPGTVIGKALENFNSQKGTILVLVNLQ